MDKLGRESKEKDTVEILWKILINMIRERERERGVKAHNIVYLFQNYHNLLERLLRISNVEVL